MAGQPARAPARMTRRLRLASSVLDISADSHVLEVGCGSGLAVAMVCERLRAAWAAADRPTGGRLGVVRPLRTSSSRGSFSRGRITAIDRSASAIAQATERNMDDIATGIAVLRQADLATFAHRGTPFDSIFAINVNVFWSGAGAAEIAAIDRCLARDGAVHFIYERPDAAKADLAANACAAALVEHGFLTRYTAGGAPTLFAVSARRRNDA